MIQLKLGVVWFVLLTRHPACLVCHQVALGVCASRPRRDARTCTYGIPARMAAAAAIANPETTSIA